MGNLPFVHEIFDDVVENSTATPLSVVVAEVCNQHLVCGPVQTIDQVVEEVRKRGRRLLRLQNGSDALGLGRTEVRLEDLYAFIVEMRTRYGSWFAKTMPTPEWIAESRILQQRLSDSAKAIACDAISRALFEHSPLLFESSIGILNADEEEYHQFVTQLEKVRQVFIAKYLRE
jgi:hypothetical protein